MSESRQPEEWGWHLVKGCYVPVTADLDAVPPDLPDTLSVRHAAHADVSCKNGWIDRDAIWHVVWGGPSNHVLDGGPDSRFPREGAILGVGKGSGPSHREHELSASKRGRSRWHLACRLDWALATMY